MHVEWKIVTGNPQVTRKLKSVQKCAEHATPEPQACASDLGDDSHVTC